MQPKVTVVIAEYNSINRIGMKTFFSSKDSNIEIIGEAEDAFKLMNLLRNTSPSIILMEISLRMRNYLLALREIKKLYPAIKVIMLADDNNHRESLTQAMLSGANGYIKKSDSPDQFCKIVQNVFKENFHPNDFLDEKIWPVEKALEDFLTEKEILVLSLMYNEKSTKEIAEIMDLSPRTIEDIRDRLKIKTGTKSMIGLVKFAIKKGLTEIQPQAI